ncbi:uncharacterized protein L3040_000202 [Drepanopeziza brunnea f. sp. 'multigermtubi']|uniref:DNA polymerase delta n=1 Tax=Marssonina brunnea f. sp. multigermtubi (strain MB_m1) TaxID=1072389 RepID=K1XQ66_MARBU|nr:DNA polymerase delta [Drepanopeziza brunnea f. sp. 'multigermtubi' MB_m1]EKD14679.1 DNA polymerase delta [Drepanopeziza brunnea f. sp. 'multigermtubi' MB_m1]KAJ5053912.1 hypothetical protein L3040_000202 [Drepanopeziza brunnea f. sp. 'multigermtubi']
MPPTRRSRTSSGPAAAAAAAKGSSQKTLSFGAKVSKPTTPHGKALLGATAPTASDSKPSPLSKTVSIPLATPPSTAISQAPPTDIATEPGHAAAARQQGLEGQSAEEQRAAKVTDAQIKRYWRQRESERVTRRVHQEALGVEEKILRLWDVSSQFGPAIGMARMKRWVRANKLGLNPPIEVLAVLLREEGKGNKDIERAHVDELMSSKFVVGDVA